MKTNVGFKVKVSQDIIDRAMERANSHTTGRQSGWNGNPSQKMSGYIGEIFIQDLVGYKPEDCDGFDGGWDLPAGEHLIDVKTQVWGEANVNLSGTVFDKQIQYDATGYIFCVYDGYTKELNICGCCSKERLMEIGTHYNRGDVTEYGLPTKIDHWAIKYGDLKYLNNEDAVKTFIRQLTKGYTINYY